MQILISEHFWWVTGSVCYGVLALVLCVRRIYKVAPFFSIWVCESLLASEILFLTSRVAGKHAYATVYWTLAVVELALQIAVAYEFAAKSLRHKREWIQGTKTQFLMCFGAAFLLSAGLAWKAQPAIVDPLDAYYTRLELFASDLVFFVAVITLVISYACGSLWRRQDLFRFVGFLVWSGASSISDSLHIYWRTAGHFAVLEACHIFLDAAVAIYWTVASFTSSGRASTHQPDGMPSLAVLYDPQT